jgi:hypothetical protein
VAAGTLGEQVEARGAHYRCALGGKYVTWML